MWGCVPCVPWPLSDLDMALYSTSLCSLRLQTMTTSTDSQRRSSPRSCSACLESGSSGSTYCWLLATSYYLTAMCYSLLTPSSFLFAPHSSLLTPHTLLFVPYSLLFAPCSMLVAQYVARCPWLVVRCSMLFALCALLVARSSFLVPRCAFLVARCPWFFARCSLPLALRSLHFPLCSYLHFMLAPFPRDVTAHYDFLLTICYRIWAETSTQWQDHFGHGDTKALRSRLDCTHFCLPGSSLEFWAAKLVQMILNDGADALLPPRAVS